VRRHSDGLLVAATAAELPAPAPWDTLLCGVGPVDAAVHTAQALATQRPALLLLIGIAGARRAAALPLGTLVLGTAAHYDDLGVPPRFAPATLAPDASLLAAARAALPAAEARAIATVGRIGAAQHADVEAMEGFAVLRAAQLAGVPALELRAISNVIEEHDRARWDIAGALAALHAVLPSLLPALRGAVPTALPR
jgi:nucleoside phosphorylase